MVKACESILRIVTVHDSTCAMVTFELNLFWKLHFIKLISKYILHVRMKPISKLLNTVELNDFLETMGLI